MYTIIGNLLREKGSGGVFGSLDLNVLRELKLSKLFENYLDGYLVLSHPSLSRPTHYPIRRILDTDSPSNIIGNLTVSSWLSSIGNRTLPGYVMRPRLVSGGISYVDAVQGGYKVKVVHPQDVSGDNSYPSDMLRDIWIRRPMSEIGHLHDRTLTTVNGLLHLNIPSEDGLLIKEGGTTSMVGDDMLVGVISFEGIGDLWQRPITDDNLVQVPPPGTGLQDLRHGVYVNLDMDLSNRTVLLSLCGILQFDVVKVINDSGLVRLDLSKVDIYKIVQLTMWDIDYNKVGIDTRPYMVTALNYENVTSDEVVDKLLRLLQTFLIVVDTPHLVKQTHALHHVRQDGYYEANRHLPLPMVDDHGRLVTYWKVVYDEHDGKFYRYYVKSSVYHNALMDTQGAPDREQTYNTNYEYVPRTQYHTGNLMNLLSEKLIYV